MLQNLTVDRAQTKYNTHLIQLLPKILRDPLSIVRTTCLVQGDIQIYQVISFYNRDGEFTVRYELKIKI